MLLAGANPNIKDKWDRTAIQVAELSGFPTSSLWNVESKIPVDMKKEKVTAVLTHPMCIRHFTCPPSTTNSPQAPPENIRRLTVLLDKVSYRQSLSLSLSLSLSHSLSPSFSLSPSVSLSLLPSLTLTLTLSLSLFLSLSLLYLLNSF